MTTAQHFTAPVEPVTGRPMTEAVKPAPEGDWRVRAACATEDPNLFFPTGTHRQVRDLSRDAQRVCFRCPVIEKCLKWALESGEDVGVFGGLSAEDRRRMRRGQSRIAGSVVVEVTSREPDPEVVAAYLDGRVSDVPDVDRLAAIAMGVQKGMSYKDFDELHGLGKNGTSSFVRRIRIAFEDNGMELPWMVRPSSSKRVFTADQVEAIRVRAACEGVTDTELAAEYEVHRSTITSLITGESYPDAPGPIRQANGYATTDDSERAALDAASEAVDAA